jgi:hypothetical protein
LRVQHYQVGAYILRDIWLGDNLCIVVSWCRFHLVLVFGVSSMTHILYFQFSPLRFSSLITTWCTKDNVPSHITYYETQVLTKRFPKPYRIALTITKTRRVSLTCPCTRFLNCFIEALSRRCRGRIVGVIITRVVDPWDVCSILWSWKSCLFLCHGILWGCLPLALRLSWQKDDSVRHVLFNIKVIVYESYATVVPFDVHLYAQHRFKRLHRFNRIYIRLDDELPSKHLPFTSARMPKYWPWRGVRLPNDWWKALPNCELGRWVEMSDRPKLAIADVRWSLPPKISQ